MISRSCWREIELTAIRGLPNGPTHSSIAELAYLFWKISDKDAVANWYAAINAVRFYYAYHGYNVPIDWPTGE